MSERFIICVKTCRNYWLKSNYDNENYREIYYDCFSRCEKINEEKINEEK